MDAEPRKLADCGRCRHLKAYVTWWCRHPEAPKLHGTAIPEVIIKYRRFCPFFEPVPPPTPQRVRTWWERVRAWLS